MNFKKNMGYKVVLTADRTLMSEYSHLIFLGFSACVPKGLIPDTLYFSLFCPAVKANRSGAAKYAPCGTRKIEAELLNSGFKREDIIVAHPDHLDKTVGSATKVLAITENDPLGIGPASTTFIQLLGGQAYMNVKFKELLNHPAVKKYKPTIIVGGPGAWQLEEDEVREALGVDCVVVGEGEKVAPAAIKKVVEGEPVSPVIHGEVTAVDRIPAIAEPTIDGIIEIARGCGRGCAFCVPTLQQYRCLPIEHILKEVEVNLKAGRRPLLHAEDVLRYKARGFKINKVAVSELFSTVYNYPGVHSVAISHFALSSVASAPDLIEDLSRIMEVGKDGMWFSGQTGVETGSPRLIRELMAGKCEPFEPEEWPQVVVNAFQTLSDNLWVPVATLIIGLPGETPKDIDLTIGLIEKLHDFKSLLVPLLFVSEGTLKGKVKSFSIENLTPKQSELFLNCWDHNLDWAKTLMKEYFFVNNFVKKACFRSIFSYTVTKGKRMIQQCRDDYGYDLPAMIKDAREGKLKVAPMPIQFIYRLINH